MWRKSSGDLKGTRKYSESPGTIAIALSPMRVERMELRLLRLPLGRFFETSVGRSDDRRFVVVTAEENGVAGIGECVADANPFYSAETTRTAWHIITEFIAPPVAGPAPAAPGGVLDSTA